MSVRSPAERAAQDIFPAIKTSIAEIIGAEIPMAVDWESQMVTPTSTRTT